VIKGYDKLRTQRATDTTGDTPQFKVQTRDIGIDKFFKSIKNWFETEDMS
jgi:hypothetical protein